MKEQIFNFCDGILSGKRPISQLFVFSCSIVTAIMLYCCSKENELLQIIFSDFNYLGHIIVLILYFLISLCVFQIIFQVFRHIKLNQNFKKQIKQKRQNILDTFDRLTEWQKIFLVKAVRHKKQQFQGYEIGNITCLWQPEMDVLVAKGIVSEVRFEVYLIDNDFFDVIREHVLEQINSA
ncbi:hypothetical protein FACS18942_03080 [Planctomycetales bacterium]|nr:hypothetical protein FACS18942_03080 [Planctomycetales bacterium]